MTKETFEPSRPKGTGATRLKFNNTPSMKPDADAAKSNPKMQTEMFGKNALGSEIGTTSEYAAKSKKGYYNESLFKVKPNVISPTTDY